MRDENSIEARILIPWSMQEEASLFLMDLTGRDVIVEDGGRPEEGTTIRALFESGSLGDAQRRELEDYLRRLGDYGMQPLGLELRPVNARKWIDERRDRAVARHVGTLWTLCPPWKDYEPRPGGLLIVLEGSGAFGSGWHPSTVLSLTALEQAWRKGMLPAYEAGWKALDVGTGTGILAVAAARLGAEVLAFDIDDGAVAAAERNVRLNGVQDRVKVEETPLRFAKGRFRLVLANVALPEQMELAAIMDRLLIPGSIVIVSGFLDVDAAMMEERYRLQGLRCEARLSHGDWVSMILEFPNTGRHPQRGADDRNVS